jgi:hypothetical protein
LLEILGWFHQRAPFARKTRQVNRVDEVDFRRAITRYLPRWTQGRPGGPQDFQPFTWGGRMCGSLRITVAANDPASVPREWRTEDGV